MNPKRASTSLVIILYITAIFIVSTMNHSVLTVHGEGQGLIVDLFTNKAPYDGKGANQISDAFSPYETIVLYASVTYNGDTVAGVQVSFQITAPNSSLNQFRSPATNQSGVANVTFNIPGQNLAVAFGKWFVLARISIGGLSALDTLTFKVGYLVTATMKTVTPAQYPQTPVENHIFSKGGNVGLIITLTNIALSSKDVTMSLTVTDAMNQVIYTVDAVSPPFMMPPGNFTYPLIIFPIPTSAASGTATITLNVYEQSSAAAYSPEKSITFDILLIDVAVTGVNLSSTQVSVGQVISISATVKNLGNINETFNATIYYNNTAITTFNIASLEPSDQKTLTLSWNTSSVTPGVYTISAAASKVPGETNTSNNRYIAGQVMITEKSAPTPFNTRDLYIILWIILLLFLIALLALLVFRRRKKDESETLEQMSYFM
jgi:hypothetical protein